MLVDHSNVLVVSQITQADISLGCPYVFPGSCQTIGLSTAFPLAILNSSTATDRPDPIRQLDWNAVLSSVVGWCELCIGERERERGDDVRSARVCACPSLEAKGCTARTTTVFLLHLTTHTLDDFIVIESLHRLPDIVVEARHRQLPAKIDILFHQDWLTSRTWRFQWS